MSFNLREEIIGQIWIRNILPQIHPQVSRNQRPQNVPRRRQ